MPKKDKLPPVAITPKGSFYPRGYFYVVQLLPKELPYRLKLGWSQNIRGRLSTYRCSCPGARLLWSWPCPTVAEGQALQAVEDAGWQRHGREVFDCHAQLELHAFLKRFFTDWASMESSDAFIRESQSLRQAADRASRRRGHIHLEASGRWRGQISVGFDTEGKRRRYGVMANTREEAEQALQKLSEALARGDGL
jgi:hypothetical protein